MHRMLWPMFIRCRLLLRRVLQDDNVINNKEYVHVKVTHWFASLRVLHLFSRSEDQRKRPKEWPASVKYTQTLVMALYHQAVRCCDVVTVTWWVEDLSRVQLLRHSRNQCNLGHDRFMKTAYSKAQNPKCSSGTLIQEDRVMSRDGTWQREDDR